MGTTLTHTTPSPSLSLPPSYPLPHPLSPLLSPPLSRPLQEQGVEAPPAPDPEGPVLGLLAQCEEKLRLLHEELQGMEPSTLLKEMEEDEVRLYGPL